MQLEITRHICFKEQKNKIQQSFYIFFNFTNRKSKELLHFLIIIDQRSLKSKKQSSFAFSLIPLFSKCEKKKTYDIYIMSTESLNHCLIVHTGLKLSTEFSLCFLIRKMSRYQSSKFLRLYLLVVTVGYLYKFKPFFF